MFLFTPYVSNFINLKYISMAITLKQNKGSMWTINLRHRMEGLFTKFPIAKVPLIQLLNNSQSVYFTQPERKPVIQP